MCTCIQKLWRSKTKTLVWRTRLLVLFIVVNSLQVAYAQIPTVQDCLGAIAVCQGIYDQGTAFSGVGNYAQEIDPTLSCLGSGEKNDVWYVITVQSSGNLSFTITPNNYTPGSIPANGDDYDWALFNLTHNVCSDISVIDELEVSCNYSGERGPTGANGRPGGLNEPVVPVLAGETFVLNVSNFSTSQSGYRLSFTASTAVILDNQKPSMIEVLPTTCFDSILTVRFSEFLLCSSVDLSDFQLTGPGGVYHLNSVSAPGCIGGGHHDRDFTFDTDSVFVDGYYELALTGEVKDLCANTSAPGIIGFSIVDSHPPTLVALANSPCLGTTLQLTATSYQSGAYLWSGPNGFSSTKQSPTIANVTTTANGVYQVTATLRNGCVFTDAVTVTINPSPPPVQKNIYHD
ncbi:MAG: hypothetical protein CVU06_02150 [Bacteroidetes bacterium HGW-Bacteroidetes-22]|nr:MAG: hypothetical protein CVU06_02150 [Bacteroidetes bacterium HGW-Bacteroidetes-22]